MAIVGSITVSQSAAIRMVESLNHDDFYFLRSKVDEIEFGSGKESLLSNGLWEMGRLFNEEYEIRWRLDEDQYKIVVLTEMGDLPKLPDRIEYGYTEDGWDTAETQIMLWGDYKTYSDDAQGFLEVKIPDFLKYPIPKAARWIEKDEAMIHGVDYLKDGIILYTRFKEVAKNVL